VKNFLSTAAKYLGADAIIQLQPTLYLQPEIYLLIVDGGNTHWFKNSDRIDKSGVIIMETVVACFFYKTANL
jgi:hypothetical protein